MPRSGSGLHLKQSREIAHLRFSRLSESNDDPVALDRTLHAESLKLPTFRIFATRSMLRELSLFIDLPTYLPTYLPSYLCAIRQRQHCRKVEPSTIYRWCARV